MKQTFSISEAETAKAAGWMLVKENIIAGKVRSVVMEKEGNPFHWIEEDNRIRSARFANLSKHDQKIRRQREALRHRGFDI